MLFKLALVLSAIVALGLAGEECGIRGPGLRYRVIGGRDTKPGEFPWMVTTGGCGASLINNQWLVTAAHCGASSTKEFKVGLGVFDKAKYTKDNDQPDAVTVIASKRIVHPDFGDHLKNDVAVIKLKTPLDLTGEHKHLSPVCLPEANMPKEALNGTICTATGWGQTTWDDRGHDMPKDSFPLQQVDVPVVDSKTCLKMFPDDYFEELKICAGGNEKGGESVCFGDSGGPLQCKLADGKYHLIGIVSYGEPCAVPGYPDTYTRVSTFVPWILETIAAN